jgi:hypothetical protein
MEVLKITAEKKDAYKIRELLDQIVFKTMLADYAVHCNRELFEGERTILFKYSQKIVTSIMHEPKIEIILKRVKR